ncbi:MAG: acyl-CoA dehydrogenase family protein, partial [Burkholderiaceae bacterium]
MKIFERMALRRQWNEEERLILDSVQRLADEVIAPSAAAYDESAQFPWDNVTALNALGLNAIFIPEAYGGLPASYRLYLECVKIVSEACASTGIIYATNFHGMKPLIDFGTEEQKQRLLPAIAQGGLASLAITESSAGSDATGMKTSFTADGDNIIVNGSKIFITNGDVADRLLVFGKWSGIDDAKKSISVLIVESGSAGLSVVRTEKKMGHRASSTAELAFNNCRVRRTNLLGTPGQGLEILLASLNKS